MEFSKTEAKLYEFGRGMDLVKTNLDKMFAQEMDGMSFVAFYRALKSSNNPKLTYYAERLESAESKSEAERVAKLALHEISRLPKGDIEKFANNFQAQMTQIFKQIIKEADNRYGISDVIEAYMNKRAIPSTNALNNTEINIDGIKFKGRFIQELYINGVQATLDLPGRNGLFNKPEINVKVPPQSLRISDTESNNLMYA